jgi:hypothetical protein
MHTRLIALLCALALTGLAQEAAKLIPVQTWPRVLYADGKQIVNPDPSTCMKAGYRLIPAKPIPPQGKYAVSESLVQDGAKAESMKWVISYADIPAPPPPEGVVTAAADRVRFIFSTAGVYRAAVWLDAPITNKVEK